MKSKILVPLFLALVLILTLATPVMAAKPGKGDLYLLNDGVKTAIAGKVSLQRTHDGFIKLSLFIEDATPGQQYYVRLGNGAAYWDDSNVYADSRGVVRARLISTEPIASSTIAIFVDEAPYDTEWDYGTYAIYVSY